MGQPAIGRPSKLDEAKAGKAVEGVEARDTDRGRSTLLGIARSTFYDWLKRGARALVTQAAGQTLVEGEERFAEFYLASRGREASGETRQLETIEAASRAGPQFWTAAAWQLERRMPEKYALKARVDHRHVYELRALDVGREVEEIEGGHTRSEEIAWTKEGVASLPCTVGSGSEAMEGTHASGPGGEEAREVFGPHVRGE